MRYVFLVGLGSGLVSALLFYSSARGGPLLRPILLLLTPIPSLVAGFGWGWLPAATGAAAGGLIVAALAGGTIAVGYLIALGVPAALAAYLVYLSRPDPEDTNSRQWYPVGRLMAAMTLYAGALPVLFLPLIGGSYDGMRPYMSEMLRQFSKRWLPPGAQLTDQALAEQTDLALSILPAGLSLQWLSACAVNLYLAGRIVRASGRLGRDWPDLAALTLPPGLALLLVLALFGAAGGGTVGVIGTSFTGAFLGAYLLAGLALVHFVSRGRAPWLVWLVYLGLLLPFMSPFFMPVVAFAGLLDSTLGLKQRLGSQPPT